MVVYKLNRKGEFTIKTIGEWHCGTKDNLRIQYDVSVICDADSLDFRGFLFDQTKLDAMFQSLRVVHLSCEMFCAELARRAYRQIHHENVNCNILSLDVTLSPEPFAASVTHSYTKDASHG